MRRNRSTSCVNNCCWNAYFRGTLFPGVSTLPQSWSAGVTDDQSAEDRLKNGRPPNTQRRTVPTGELELSV
ncbi:hypothetical protein EG68_02354 [Paragonimus skrjabini miyazakii]|uniref:Uncharacterized protein n=1 Tax=Paragonimus skrjabini miyazakii TaxID=59628 RepID=A0A8S9YYJ7_9TREM|nr:hypothetical protein EG68_02354 [Paragonimus skrjabini miyazakii]